MKLSSRHIIVLRIGHRPERDKRLTTHLGLTARAFGAQGFWIAGPRDPQVIDNIRRVCDQWGHRDFEVRSGVSWRRRIRSWKSRGGEVIHLSMYGLHVDDVITTIQTSPHDKLVVVGGPKVPGDLFTLADLNVAIGHQPHSEVAALAVFLDRFFKGSVLRTTPKDATRIIEPTPHGKQIRRLPPQES